MEFDQFGDVQACCANALYPLGNVRDLTLEQIWHGERAAALRAALRRHDYSFGCTVCRHRLQYGYGELPRDYYDNFPMSSLDPAWPEPGAMLAWDSHPDGRGLVIERVVTREPGSFLEVAVHDRQLTGTQRVAFGVTRDLEAVRVALALDYELTRSGPLMRLADPLFVRRALRDSLRRTLDRLAGELECRRRPAP